MLFVTNIRRIPANKGLTTFILKIDFELLMRFFSTETERDFIKGDLVEGTYLEFWEVLLLLVDARVGFMYLAIFFPDRFLKFLVELGILVSI